MSCNIAEQQKQQQISARSRCSIIHPSSFPLVSPACVLPPLFDVRERAGGRQRVRNVRGFRRQASRLPRADAGGKLSDNREYRRRGHDPGADAGHACHQEGRQTLQLTGKGAGGRGVFNHYLSGVLRRQCRGQSVEILLTTDHDSPATGHAGCVGYATVARARS